MKPRHSGVQTPTPRRLSLEQKIRRIARLYRARERRRQRKEETLGRCCGAVDKVAQDAFATGKWNEVQVFKPAVSPISKSAAREGEECAAIPMARRLEALRYSRFGNLRYNFINRRGRYRSFRNGWTAVGCALAFLALVALPAGATTSTTFDQANQAYAAGHFSEAAHGFEQAIAEQGYSAPLLFNLGNAWLKAGQPGRAILNYERAQVLAPRDHALATNLRLAREQAGIVVPEANVLEKAARLLSWNTLAWIGLSALVLMCGAILAGRLRPSFLRTGLRFLVAGSAVALAMVATALTIRWPELDRAVVLAPDTPAHIAPAEAAGVLFKLPAGETIHARQAHGGFLLVRTGDGHSGWVSDTQVAKVMASGHDALSAKTKSVATTKYTSNQ